MQKVSAAVTDIDEAEPIFVKPGGHHRGTHSAEVGIPASAMEYLVVRKVSGTQQPIASLGNVGPWELQTIRRLPARRDYCLDGDGTGQFAMVLATHTIGNDPQIYFLSHSERVFVVLAYPAYVGRGSDVDAELRHVGHANSLSYILFKRYGVRRPLQRPVSVINGLGPSLLFLQSAALRPFFLVDLTRYAYRNSPDMLPAVLHALYGRSNVRTQ
jgi:hypothetical protein